VFLLNVCESKPPLTLRVRYRSPAASASTALKLAQEKYEVLESASKAAEEEAAATIQRLQKQCHVAERAAEDEKSRAASAVEPLLLQLQNMEAELDTARDTITELRASASTHSNAVRLAEERLRTGLQQMESKLAEAEASRDEADAMNTTLRESNQSVETACQQLRSQLEEEGRAAADIIAQQKSHLEECRGQIRTLEQTVEATKAALDAERSAAAELETQLRQQHERDAVKSSPSAVVATRDTVQREKVHDTGPSTSYVEGEKALEADGQSASVFANIQHFRATDDGSRQSDALRAANNRIDSLMKRVSGTHCIRVLRCQYSKLSPTVCAKLPKILDSTCARERNSLEAARPVDPSMFHIAKTSQGTVFKRENFEVDGKRCNFWCCEGLSMAL